LDLDPGQGTQLPQVHRLHHQLAGILLLDEAEIAHQKPMVGTGQGCSRIQRLPALRLHPVGPRRQDPQLQGLGCPPLSRSSWHRLLPTAHKLPPQGGIQSRIQGAIASIRQIPQERGSLQLCQGKAIEAELHRAQAGGPPLQPRRFCGREHLAGAVEMETGRHKLGAQGGDPGRCPLSHLNGSLAAHRFQAGSLHRHLVFPNRQSIQAIFAI
jgi:hypothetical protein